MTVCAVTGHIKGFIGWEAEQLKVRLRNSVIRHLAKTLCFLHSHFIILYHLRNAHPSSVCWSIQNADAHLGGKIGFPVTFPWLWIYGCNCIACFNLCICSIWIFFTMTKWHTINKWTCAASAEDWTQCLTCVYMFTDRCSLVVSQNNVDWMNTTVNFLF